MEEENLQRVLRLFNQAIGWRIFKLALDELVEEDLTQVQFSCIRFVHLHPEPSVGMIADGLGVSDAASAKLIDRLFKKGLLTREEDSHDRRVLKIKLTDTGEKLFESVCSLETKFFESIFKQMTPETLSDLESGIVGFLNAALEKPEQIDEICLKCGWDHELDCVGNLRYRELTGIDKVNV